MQLIFAMQGCLTRFERICVGSTTSRFTEPAFPIADEAEDPTIWLPLLADKSPHSSLIIHILLATGDGRSPQEIEASSLLGGMIFEYYPVSKTAMATYLSVRPKMRGHGIAKFLLARTLEILGTPAEASTVPLFAEAENARDQPDEATQDLACRRLRIFGPSRVSQIADQVSAARSRPWQEATRNTGIPCVYWRRARPVELFVGVAQFHA